MNWPLMNFVVLLVAFCASAVAVGLFWRWLAANSPTWTGPGQAKEIAQHKLEQAEATAQLRRDLEHALRLGVDNKHEIESAHRKADGIARETLHFQRVIQSTADHQIAEIQRLEAKLDEMLTVRDRVGRVELQAMKTEQDLTGLACFMRDAQTLPGFCPLHNVECPLTPAGGTAVVTLPATEPKETT